jgi:hypothetical protein
MFVTCAVKVTGIFELLDVEKGVLLWMDTLLLKTTVPPTLPPCNDDLSAFGSSTECCDACIRLGCLQSD